MCKAGYLGSFLDDVWRAGVLVKTNALVFCPSAHFFYDLFESAIFSYISDLRSIFLLLSSFPCLRLVFHIDNPGLPPSLGPTYIGRPNAEPLEFRSRFPSLTVTKPSAKRFSSKHDYPTESNRSRPQRLFLQW